MSPIKAQGAASISLASRHVERWLAQIGICVILVPVNRPRRRCRTAPHKTTADALRREAVSVLLNCLSPFSPHIAEELWEMLGNADLVSVAPWPVAETDALAQDAVTVVVQINGKVRARLELPAGLDGADLEARVMADPTVRERLDGRPVVKTIVVPDKLVNIVVKG